MCGIAGFVDFKRGLSQQHLISMTDCLRYRGPDGSGYQLLEGASANVGLGHRRLSIIDLSPAGAQPMYSEDGSLVIIFNGEIYNFQEIRTVLAEKGHKFRSSSDTETIIYAFREWGPEAVHHFIGMFAFVIYDRTDEMIWLFRDRVGVKPLYYHYKPNDQFLFSSEIKSFLQIPGYRKEISEEAFKAFLRYSFVPAPLSIFKDTFKLEPGHYLRFDLRTQQLQNHRYWDALSFYKKEKIKGDINDIMPELESRLRKACEYRMVSDVPVGVFLSGGYDSTLVTALLQSGKTERLKTFTIGFENKQYNEAIYAAEVAKILETDHHEMICTDNEVKSILPDLPEYFDEPFGDSSAIPTMLVSRFARRHVTVALSADGGDELFAGYKRYDAIMSLDAKMKKQPKLIRKSLGASIQKMPGFLIERLMPGNTSPENLSKYANFFKGKIDIVDMIDYANQTAMPAFIIPFLTSKELSAPDFYRKDDIRSIREPLDQLLAFDYLSYLPGDILTKIDRASMSSSLEGREPLLDHSLFEYVAQLPGKFKYDTLTSKLIMRKITHRLVPERIMNRPKMGFSIPLVDWFRTDLKHHFEDTLTEKAVSSHGLIDYARLREELDEYYKGNGFQFSLLWNIYVFQSWYNRWMRS